MTSQTLTKIDVFSAAKIAGILYAGLGLFGGIFVAAISLLAGAVGSNRFGENHGALFGVLFGFGAIVIFPILYGVMGLLVGAVMAALYNLIARTSGGLRFEVSQ